MVRKLEIMMMVLAVSAGLIIVSGCQSDGQTGALIGSGIGAGVGALAGGHTESTLIGAAVGGGVGYILGNESDKTRAAAERSYIRQEMSTETVYFTNSNGSMSKVKLRKYGVGYLGTRGEYYRSMPTEEQLRVVYGF